MVENFLKDEYEALQRLTTELETLQSQNTQLIEEHGAEGGLLEDATNDKGSITKTTITSFLKQVDDIEAKEIAQELKSNFEKETSLKKQVKSAEAELDENTLEAFSQLNEPQVKDLIVHKKWLNSMELAINQEIDSISQTLAKRVKELAERYEYTLGELDQEVKELETKVNEHLAQMGLEWS